MIVICFFLNREQLLVKFWAPFFQVGWQLVVSYMENLSVFCQLPLICVLRHHHLTPQELLLLRTTLPLLQQLKQLEQLLQGNSLTKISCHVFSVSAKSWYFANLYQIFRNKQIESQYFCFISRRLKCTKAQNTVFVSMSIPSCLCLF